MILQIEPIDPGMLEEAFNFLGDNVSILFNIGVLIGIIIWAVTRFKKALKCEKDEVKEEAIKHCDEKMASQKKEIDNRMDTMETKQKSTDEAQNKTLNQLNSTCLLYTSPSPRDRQKSRMPSSA